jgi:hypothetical protein
MPMKRKIIAVILELIPVISAPVSYLLIVSSHSSGMIRRMISVTMLLAFLGFVFFFIGRRLAAGDKAVRILGVFDWLATLSVIAFYIIAVFSFGL